VQGDAVTTPPIDLDAVHVAVVRTAEEMQAALSVRFRVFVEEQRVPVEEEVDRYDDRPWERDDVVHVLARYGDAPVATARLPLDLHEPDAEGHAGYPHIGRVAVLAELRGTGIGRLIMESLQAEARQRGYAGVTLAAQLHAMPFYERLGYIARGPVFLEAGIEHRDMDLRLE